MINSLVGVVSNKSSSELFLEMNGVEWCLVVSERTAREVPPVGDKARVFTYLHHREDQMTLYGFAGTDERFLFHDLLRVSGIGPKQAIRILSGMSVEQIVKSLDADDIDGLSRIPGLGKKTAQKIILALRGRLTLPHEDDEKVKPFAEIVTALIEMGFEKQSATRVVERCAADISEESMSSEDREKEIFRRAIVSLSSHQ
jgi:holliday junction DNA helicase RuvA